MSHDVPTIPQALYVDLTPPVRALAKRYYRLRNLLVRIRDMSEVPEEVRDLVRVYVGLYTKEVDLTELDRAERMCVSFGGGAHY